jgi:hypothetical protein
MNCREEGQTENTPEPFRSGGVIFDEVLIRQILTHELLEKLVPVQLADQGPGPVVVGDVGGVFGEDIAHDLIDGVITLLGQRGVDGRQNPLHFLVIL